MTDKSDTSREARERAPEPHHEPAAKEKRPRHGFGTRLRNYFLTGLIVVGPVTVTVYLVWWFVNWVDGWVKPFVPDFSSIIPDWQGWIHQYWPNLVLPQSMNITIPGVGLVFAIFGLTFIGALAANLLGRTLVSYTELFVGRLPIVRSVYKPVKQIFETVLSQGNSSFRRACLIEFPHKGCWAVAFVSTEPRGEIAERLAYLNQEMLTVFLPATPPTSGYLMFIPRSEVIILDMSVEDAAKFILSAGLVSPEHRGKTAALALEAKRA